MRGNQIAEGVCRRATPEPGLDWNLALAMDMTHIIGN